MPIRRPLLLVVVPAVLAVGAVLTLPDAAEELFRAGMESMADRKYREAADSFSKLATEHLAHNYYKQHGLPTCSIRPFNIYGPGQVGEGAVHAFVVRALKNEPITIHNQGDQIRSWCYIDDIVDGILLALEKEEAVGHAFNIGNPRSTITIYQLARLIVRLSGSRSEITFVPWEQADVELRIPDVKKAERLLGFEPRVDLEDGLARTIDWYRQKLRA